MFSARYVKVVPWCFVGKIEISHRDKLRLKKAELET
jgi:hypothetical protein